LCPRAATGTVYELAALGHKLERVGRVSGLFQPDDALWHRDSEHACLVALSDGRSAGLVATQDGQVGFWVVLPADALGSVLDTSDLSPRVTSVLRSLQKAELLTASAYAFAQRVAPSHLLLLGPAGAVRKRRSVPYAGATHSQILVSATNSTDAENISEHLPGIVAHLMKELVEAAG
jgi:hypothetical protein